MEQILYHQVLELLQLDLVPGGYIGLIRQGNVVNLCGLMDLAVYRRSGPDMDGALRIFARANSSLTSHLQNARRSSEWKAVGPVVMGLRQLTHERTFFVGDSACVVDPFAGEGIAMALAGAGILQEAFKNVPDNPALEYERLWHRRFDRSIRIQGMLRKTHLSKFMQEALTFGCRSFPPLLRWLTEVTRPPLPVQNLNL